MFRAKAQNVPPAPPFNKKRLALAKPIFYIKDCCVTHTKQSFVSRFIMVYQDIWDKGFESKSPSRWDFEANL